jgi:Cu(I)/Ag(I) efflux system membrane protein CusA/SilA
MRFGENAKATIDNVKARIETLKASLPSGVNIVPVYDRSTLIDNAVDNLWSKLVEELLVVGAVCLVFLFHVRSSLVAIITLPIGILMAFIVMKFQGLNANIMSLGGIAIAMGAIVDGAIVLVENLHKHIERATAQGEQVKGEARWALVVKSANEVGPALFFSLLIITVSFIPVFTLEAQEGRMFAPLAFTKSYAMAAAAALAITLVPVLAGYFVTGKVKAEHRNLLNRAISTGYVKALTAALNHPRKIVFAALIALVSVVWPMQHIGSEFMPSLDEGDLLYMPTTYPGISVGKARELLQQTDKLIATIPEVQNVFGKVGRADTATDPAPLTMIETFVQLKPKSQWRAGMTTSKLREILNSTVQFPGVSNAWVMPIKTRIDMLATGIKTPVGIKIAGPELAGIQQVGVQIEQALQDFENTASVFAEKVAGGRYITIDISRDRAARYGLNIADIQEVINTAIGGRTLGETVEGRQRFPISMRYPQQYRDSPEALRQLPIVLANGANITLGEVADIAIEVGPAAIKSENARLNGWVFIDIESGDLGSYVQSAKEHIANTVSLPPGYSLTWAGQFEYLERAEARLSIMVPFTIAVIVLLLYLSFRRVADVALIMVTLPLALIGSYWLLYALEFNFSVAVAVGFIALAGVAVEIGVIMLVYLHQAVEAFDGKACSTAHAQASAEQIKQALKEAIIEGATRRVRPVMMTALSIIIGLLPVLYATGTGAEVMRRIAAPMVGGMLSALALTLFVLPTMFYLVQAWQMKRRS